MKENEQRKEIRDAIDHRLSSLQGNPRLAQRIIAGSKGEQPIMKKKISMGLALAIVSVLIATAALAAGLIFSPRYDAAKLANKAMLDTYGITEKMMTVFYRESKQNDDASVLVTYSSVEGIRQLGIYTVTVKDGKAEAAWSYDGEDTSDGLEAKAWGAEQVEMLVTDYPEVMRFLLDRTTPPVVGGAENSPATPPISEEAYQKSFAENKANVLAAAKITLSQAKECAVKALESEYGLSNWQITLLQISDEDATYWLEDGKPTVSLYYHLSQGEEWVDKDGIYVVTVNLETGMIEDIIYDSGLAGNG